MLANLVSLAVTALISIATIAVLARVLSSSNYTTWLIATAVPTYLSLSDFGIAAAGSVRLTELVARGRLSEARRFYSTYAAAASTLVLGIVLVVLALTLTGTRLRGSVSAVVVVSLVGWVGLSFGATLLEGGLRAVNKFAVGVYGLMWLRVVDAIAVIGAAAITHELTAMALALVAGRAAGTSVFAIFADRLTGRLIRPTRFAWPDPLMLGIIRPSLGFVAASASQLVVLQGSTILAGALLPPATAVAFVATRTGCGLVRQFGQSAAFGTFNEANIAHAVGNCAQFEKIARSLRRATVALGITGAVGIVTLGGRIVSQWTGIAEGLPLTALALLAVYVFGEMLWNQAVIMHMSMERHMRLTLAQLAVGLTSMATGLGLTRLFGVVGLASAMGLYGAILGSFAIVRPVRCVDVWLGEAASEGV